MVQKKRAREEDEEESQTEQLRSLACLSMDRGDADSASLIRSPTTGVVSFLSLITVGSVIAP